MITVWSTKYALTEGITEHEVTESAVADGLVSFKGKMGFTEYLHGEGGEWHRSREAAAVRANTLRVNKIASLTKSITRLGKMTF